MIIAVQKIAFGRMFVLHSVVKRRLIGALAETLLPF